MILPFNKPGKDPASTGSYRPIALTSHLGKWMETIIVRRFSYVLEKRGLVSPYQSGFRKGRSTMDALVKVTNNIEKALKMKEIMAIYILTLRKHMILCGEKGC